MPQPVATVAIGPQSAEPAPAHQTPNRRVVLVTGLSGAGRSSCLKALEDIGYEAVDNLPLALLPTLLAGAGDPDQARRPIAIGVDIRTRDFAVEPFIAELGRLKQLPDCEVQLLFLDCDADVLARRFTETRRRHPFALDRPLADGIQLERQLVSPLRLQADLVLDTTQLGPADLRRILWSAFVLDQKSGVAVAVTSFSYRLGLPREADLVFDVRFLDNPHYEPNLRPLDGRDQLVAAHVAADPDYKPFFASLTRMLEPLLPRFYAEGKSYLTIAVGCTGGRHRSVFVAEELAAWLKDKGQLVSLFHRDVDRGSA
ncbi:MAG: RNase adapter RapZ [Proteobacteria bacterium]|nr:RNase adapter RapZ [Pseudomonadota bacterium]MBI3498458.1 RNase adapter RapZ [Pseudomonadota bacterium]